MCELGKPSNERGNITPTMKKSVEVCDTLANIWLGVWLPRQGNAGKEEGCFDLLLTCDHTFGNKTRKCEDEVRALLSIGHTFGYHHQRNFRNWLSSSEANNRSVKFDKRVRQTINYGVGS